MLASDVKVGMIFEGRFGTYKIIKLYSANNCRLEQISSYGRSTSIYIEHSLRDNSGLLNPTDYTLINLEASVVKEIDWI